jgi:hypothetical protein
MEEWLGRMELQRKAEVFGFIAIRTCCLGQERISRSIRCDIHRVAVLLMVVFNH